MPDIFFVVVYAVAVVGCWLLVLSRLLGVVVVADFVVAVGCSCSCCSGCQWCSCWCCWWQWVLATCYLCVWCSCCWWCGAIVVVVVGDDAFVGGVVVVDVAGVLCLVVVLVVVCCVFVLVWCLLGHGTQSYTITGVFASHSWQFGAP